MSAHTPGPWAFDPTESGATTVLGEDSMPVALVSQRDGLGNARLIAAAPDLLKATQGMIALFEAWRDGIFRSAGVTWEVEPPAVLASRAALARAEGRG